MSSCQQGRLYRAEERALASLDLPSLTVPEAQKLVDGWRDLEWLRREFPRVAHIEVVGKKSNRGGSVGGLVPVNGTAVASFADRLESPHVGVVEMIPAHLNALFVAHEVVHPLCESRYGNGTHSPWFARAYLTLTFLGIGTEAYQALYREFEAAGIDHRIDE